MSTRRRGAPSADRSPPRVVLDTNVVLSALVFGKGTTARLRAAWHGGHFLPLTSTSTPRLLRNSASVISDSAISGLLYLPIRAIVRKAGLMDGI